MNKIDEYASKINYNIWMDVTKVKENDSEPVIESQNSSNYTDLYALHQYKIRWWFDEKIKPYKLYDNGLLFKEFDTLDKAYEKIFEITR